jgi:hypothetical protein
LLCSCFGKSNSSFVVYNFPSEGMVFRACCEKFCVMLSHVVVFVTYKPLSSIKVIQPTYSGLSNTKKISSSFNNKHSQDILLDCSLSALYPSPQLFVDAFSSLIKWDVFWVDASFRSKRNFYLFRSTPTPHHKEIASLHNKMFSFELSFDWKFIEP